MSDLLDPPPDAPLAGGEDKAANWEPSELEQLARRFLMTRKDAVFEPLFAVAWHPVKRFLVRQGMEKKDLDDSTQNVLFRVYEQIGTYRFEAPFEGWLKSIAANEWKNLLRSRGAKKRAAEERSIDGPSDGGLNGRMELASLEDDPLMQTLLREKQNLLVETINQLPPRMSQCLKLRYLRGLKIREVAAVLHLSEATVKTHLRVGTQRLRPLLHENVEVFKS